MNTATAMKPVVPPAKSAPSNNQNGRGTLPPRALNSAAPTAKPPAATPNRPESANSKQDTPPVEHAILFQQFFKSVGTRTYVVQVKKASNENHYLVLTEANRKKDNDEIRKTRLFIYSEDFKAFFQLLSEAGEFIERNPVSPEIARKQARFWQKRNLQKPQSTSAK